MRCEVVKAAEFEAWWRELPEQLQDTVIAALERLRQRGVLLRHPDSTDLKSSRHGNMRELRINTRGEAIRVFYAFDPQRRAVVLVGGAREGRIGGSTGSTSAKRMRSMIGTCASSAAARIGRTAGTDEGKGGARWTLDHSAS